MAMSTLRLSVFYRFLFCSLGLLLFSSAWEAGGSETVLLDRIVARINGEAISLSEVEEALLFYGQEGVLPLGPPTEARLEAALNLLVEDKLLAGEFDRLDMEISPEGVEQELTRRREKWESSLGGPEEMETYLERAGIPPVRFRELFRQWVRFQWKSLAYLQSRMVRVSPTDTPSSPSLYVLSQIFWPVPATGGAALAGKALKNAELCRETLKELTGQAPVEKGWAQSLERFGGQWIYLGDVRPETLQAPLKEALAETEEKGWSQPVRTDRGVHLLFLHQLVRQDEEERWQRWRETRQRELERLREQAVIQIKSPLLPE